MPIQHPLGAGYQLKQFIQSLFLFRELLTLVFQGFVEVRLTVDCCFYELSFLLFFSKSLFVLIDQLNICLFKVDTADLIELLLLLPRLLTLGGQLIQSLFAKVWIVTPDRNSFFLELGSVVRSLADPAEFKFAI